MTTYTPLTKKIKDSNGEEIVVCSYYNTEKCCNIHKNKSCVDCPMISAFLIQLNAFEEIYKEGENDVRK